MVFRYHEWASRVGIEALLILMARFPWLWRISDTLVCIGVYLQLSSLYNPERKTKKQWLLLLGILIFPLGILFEVGSIATTLNYLWPFGAALLAITPCIKYFLGRKIKRYEYVIGALALLYAGFAELLCATLVLFFLGSAAHRAVERRRFPAYEAICLAVCTGMLIFALTCPGNDTRILLETQTWFPSFAELSPVQKIELGFSSMMKSMFLRPNLLTLALTGSLLALLIKQKRPLPVILISAIPPLFSLLYGTVGYAFPKLPVLSAVQSWVGKRGIDVRLEAPRTVLILLTLIGLLVCILIALAYAVEDKRLYGAFFFLLGVGAASRMALGLSPTVWASGERTCCYLYVTLAVVTVYLLERLLFKTAPAHSKAP